MFLISFVQGYTILYVPPVPGRTEYGLTTRTSTSTAVQKLHNCCCCKLSHAACSTTRGERASELACCVIFNNSSMCKARTSSCLFCKKGERFERQAVRRVPCFCSTRGARAGRYTHSWRRAPTGMRVAAALASLLAVSELTGICLCPRGRIRCLYG